MEIFSERRGHLPLRTRPFHTLIYHFAGLLGFCFFGARTRRPPFQKRHNAPGAVFRTHKRLTGDSTHRGQLAERTVRTPGQLAGRRGDSTTRGRQLAAGRVGGRRLPGRLAAASRPGRGRLAAARCPAPLPRAPPLLRGPFLANPARILSAQTNDRDRTRSPIKNI